ncbi:hypothetical protein [Schinkia azotoformans]|uniref:hypothetical protein n=1 Tax=Schinkia azotoformans TaxID=1454 RepID=UPI002DB78B64|nr:hypothetical protein [Schinkia azotoformans]MEC1785814.1 hypothetical protein [Schinkia azotoformans]
MHKLNLLPSQYLNLPRLERAFVIASIQLKIDEERQKEAERKAKQGKRGKRR